MTLFLFLFPNQGHSISMPTITWHCTRCRVYEKLFRCEEEAFSNGNWDALMEPNHMRKTKSTRLRHIAAGGVVKGGETSFATREGGDIHQIAPALAGRAATSKAPSSRKKIHKNIFNILGSL